MILDGAPPSPFLFSVGPEKKEFTVHSALVAQQSPTLAALVNYGMKESLEGYASLPQHDVETFVRFIEYTYTGDFESPMFDISIRPKEDYDGDLFSHAPSPFHLS